MKTINYVGFFVLIGIFGACKDESNKIKAEVTYEVITASGRWFGEYINETGEKVCNCKPPLLSGDWKYTFKVFKPFVAHIDATTDSPLYNTSNAPDVTTNIYVNKELVATNTSRWTKGATSSDYELK